MPELDDLYVKLPAFECRPGCSDCCGPVPWSREEHERIAAWLAERGRPLLKATSLACPYVDEQNRCSIYPVRPLICRAYGTFKRLRCPHGCRPRQFVDSKDERRLMKRYLTLVAEG
jgi:Fe-S-cluster containining protein